MSLLPQFYENIMRQLTIKLNLSAGYGDPLPKNDRNRNFKPVSR